MQGVQAEAPAAREQSRLSSPVTTQRPQPSNPLHTGPTTHTDRQQDREAQARLHLSGMIMLTMDGSCSATRLP